ncbi:MAG: hypothetical protein HYV68_00290 [Candidatus Taylorbacteria bacterium]|nr:hypothetical protein [Candidatus Taylorbacteria bacterium]
MDYFSLSYVTKNEARIKEKARLFGLGVVNGRLKLPSVVLAARIEMGSRFLSIWRYPEPPAASRTGCRILVGFDFVAVRASNFHIVLL